MDLKRRKLIINVSFIIVLFLTFAVSIVLFYLGIESAEVNDDDLLGSPSFNFGFMMAFTILYLIPTIIVELDVFYTARHFLLQKYNRTRHKDFINKCCCIISVLMMVILLVSFFSLYNIYTFQLLVEVVWIWVLCYILFRTVYYIIIKIKIRQ